MMYIYDTYDWIIEELEKLSTHHFEENVDNLMEKIRELREETPTTKDVCNEFADNYDKYEDGVLVKDEGVEAFRNFIKNHPEIDEGIDEDE